MVFWVYFIIVQFMSHHFQYHFDLPTDLSLNMMKTSNLDLMMVNCFSLHLWLMMDTRGFDEGNDLGYFFYSFDGSNKGNHEVSLIGYLLGSFDETALVYYG